MTSAERARVVKDLARRLGFDLVGIAPASPIPRGEYLREWLARGCAGEMAYLHRNRDTRLNPAAMLDGARSIIVAAVSYHVPEPPPPADGAARGRIARYAWGRDYHQVLRERLRRLVEALRAELAEPFGSRICVDTAPIVERELAAAAGVGWIGKNTLIIHPKAGSYLFLGEVISTLDLACDAPVADHCGSCRRCLEACPTRALTGPYAMDARRCISYLTIEHRGEIPAEMGRQMGMWVYGCDVCQEVCPFNRRAAETAEPSFAVSPPSPSPVLAEILDWSPEDYQRIVAGRAMKRATLEMFKRNAAIAAGNAGPRTV